MTVANPHLAQIAKEIISDMFRWGVIHEGSKYETLDLWTMTDAEAIEIICNMEAEELLSSDMHTSQTSRYYISDELIADFIAENWRLSQ